MSYRGYCSKACHDGMNADRAAGVIYPPVAVGNQTVSWDRWQALTRACPYCRADVGTPHGARWYVGVARGGGGRHAICLTQHVRADAEAHVGDVFSFLTGPFHCEKCAVEYARIGPVPSGPASVTALRYCV